MKISHIYKEIQNSPCKLSFNIYFIAFSIFFISATLVMLNGFHVIKTNMNFLGACFAFSVVVMIISILRIIQKLKLFP